MRETRRDGHVLVSECMSGVADTQTKQQPNDDNILAFYFYEINKIRLLTREEELQYAHRAAAGDTNARDMLVKANLRFVVKISKQYRNQGLPLSDLISEGNVGLLNALKRFDVERGYHFISYAVWWIRQAILKALYEKSRMIRLPLNRTSELTQIEKMRELDLRDNNQETDVEHVASRLGMKSAHVKNLLNVSRDFISLEAPTSSRSGAPKILDSIESRQGSQPEQLMLDQALRDDINTALSMLSRKESEVVQSRFGLNGRQRLSLKEIGVQYRLTKERIRQIEKKALMRLGHPIRSRYLRNYLPDLA